MSRYTEDGDMLLSPDECEQLQDTYTELDNALTKARGVACCISNNKGADSAAINASAWAVFDFLQEARDLLRSRAQLFGYKAQP